MQKINFDTQKKQLIDGALKIIGRAAHSFHSDIVMKWPRDTGFSRDLWEKPIEKDMVFTVSNNATYSPILWAGRKIDDGIYRGSLQMKNGGAPILNNAIIGMKKEFKDM